MPLYIALLYSASSELAILYSASSELSMLYSAVLQCATYHLSGSAVRPPALPWPCTNTCTHVHQRLSDPCPSLALYTCKAEAVWPLPFPSPVLTPVQMYSRGSPAIGAYQISI